MDDTLDDLHDDCRSIGSISNVIMEAVDLATNAEEVVGAITSGSDQPLTSKEAVLAHETFRLAFKRLGGSPYNTPLEGLRIATEDFMDKLQDIWERILGAIRKIWTKVKEYFKKVFDANKNLEKAAKNMKDRVTKVTKTASKNDGGEEFEDESLVSKFPIKSGNLSASGVLETIKTHMSYTEAVTPFFNDYSKSITELGDGMGKKSDQFLNLIKDNYGLQKEINGFVEGVSKAITGESLGFKLDELEYEKTSKAALIERTQYKVTVTGKYEVTPKNAPDSQIESVATSFDISFEGVESEDSFTSETTVERGDAGELTNICDKVMELARENSKLANTADRIDKDINKAADSFRSNTADRKQAAKDDGMKRTEASYKLIQNVFSKTSALSASYLTKLASLNVKAGRQSLRYVSASLSRW